MTVIGAKFIGGEINPDTGRLSLMRSDGSATPAVNDFVCVAGSLTDNGDSTFNFVFDGS